MIVDIWKKMVDYTEHNSKLIIFQKRDDIYSKTKNKSEKFHVLKQIPGFFEVLKIPGLFPIFPASGHTAVIILAFQHFFI